MYTITKNELMSWADNLVKLKKASLGKSGSQILKRRELEDYLEKEVKKKNIVIKKNNHPTKASYILCDQEQEVILEVLYRYKSYYTRHHVYIENEED
ncbi:hypothetical protein J7I93_00755 [Bacillus sp. ISL-47]|uniref:hypothetical protein n=1 Tax=Bacillus sp. ISL-47 TaxID=2819130 RepID=UPI001BEB28F8|nr:hypothetical protein [Bacillus sp. ISL-47]MBT2686704.1 hypothetical protein [Bacillus sp. ISL-47]MBT2706948.1 hypothetical protein [Pseudomonas sp. ISL-84]